MIQALIDLDKALRDDGIKGLVAESVSFVAKYAKQAMDKLALSEGSEPEPSALMIVSMVIRTFLFAETLEQEIKAVDKLREKINEHATSPFPNPLTVISVVEEALKALE